MIRKILMGLAAVVGFTTVAMAYNNDWTSLCKDATTYGKTGLAAMQYAGSQRGIAAEVTIAESATSTAYTIFDYGNGDNRVQLLITSAGKYQLIVNNGMSGGTKFDVTSTTDVTAGRHVFATLIRRGVSGSGMVISVIVYLDGAELFKVGDGSTSFVTGPFRNMACGTSGSANTISVSLWTATESAGTNDTDPTKIANIVADANELYPAPKVYTATVNSVTNWSQIVWSEEIEDPSVAVLELTAEDNPTITMDGAFAYKSVKIIGDATFVAADSLYEDGCWQKTILGGAFTATGTISFGAIKSGFTGAYAQTADGITLRAQNREVISINVAGGKITASGKHDPEASPVENMVPEDDNYYGVAPTKGRTWNNIDKKWKEVTTTITLKGSKAAGADGSVVDRPTIDLSATAYTTWQADISNPFLRGYLDDGKALQVAVHGVPYTKYDVIVYATSDGTQGVLSPITVNGEKYTFVDGATVKGSTTWGKANCNVPAIGDNALYIKDCTDKQLTITAEKTSGGRGTLCAVQVINQGDVLIRHKYVGEMSGNVVWTDGEADENLKKLGDPWENGQLNTITITNTAEDATFSFGAETIGQQIKFVSDYPITIDATTLSLGKLGIYDFEEVDGGVIFQLPEEGAFDPSTLPTTIKGDWKFSKTGTIVFDGKFPTSDEQTFFKSVDDWAGTVWLKNVLINDNNKLANCCNSNATLKVTGVMGYMPSSAGGNQGVANLVLEDEGDKLALEIDDSSGGYVYVYDKFTGDGTFKFATKAKTTAAVVITDVSGFTGKLLSTAGLHHDGKTATTPRPIFVGGTTGTASTNSCITVADGATINADCGWQAASAKFGATLKTNIANQPIVSGLTMQTPIYLGTKVTVEDKEDFYCLKYVAEEETGNIGVVEPEEFEIKDCLNATFTVEGAFEEGGYWYAADEAPLKVTYTAVEGFLFGDGTTTKVIETTVEEGMDPIEAGEEPVQAEAKVVNGETTTYYLTFDAALEAATAGQTVTLLKNIETATAQQWTIAKNITVDFATFKITKTVANDWVFTIADGAEVTFTGSTGGIVHKPAAIQQKNPASMIQIIGKLTVNGGVYESDYTIFKTDDIGTKAGELVVNDGTFTITPEQKYTGLTFAVMNWCTTTINGGTFNGNVVALSYQDQPYPSVVTIDGGTVTSACFYQNGASDTEVGTIKVAEGLSVVPTIMKGVEGNVVTSTTEAGYTVYTLTKAEAKIGTKYYLTFTEALEAAQADDTVTLCKNITTAEAAAFTIAKNITVDFDDYTITKTVANDWVFQIAKDANVIFKGGKGGIVHYPAVLNPVNPASMIQILGKLTVAGGAYKSDYTIFKVDEDDAATHSAKGELVVNDGTFTIEPQPQTLYTGKTYAVMNWSKATLSGGTFTGTIATLSNDGNACSQAGETIVNGTIGGTPVYTLQVTGSTYKNVPKIKGVEIDNVTLVKSPSITDELMLVEDGDYVTVQKVPEIEPVTPGEPIPAETPEQAVDIANDINTNAVLKAAMLKAPEGSGLEGEGLAAYQLCFTAVANGKNVTFELNETGTNVVVIATDAANTNALDVVLSAAETSATLTIDKPLVGFYYSLKQGDDVKKLGFKAATDQDKLAGKDDIEFTLEKPEGAGFYQTIITPTPTKVIENAGAHYRF